MAKKVGIISLGCPKNLVETENLLPSLKAIFTESLEEAQVVIINTCGFIESAKLESIEKAFEMLERGKEVILTGCLVQRYERELKEEFKEVLVFKSKEELLKYLGLKDLGGREITTPKSYAYLKIGEGCSRRCSFCAIPNFKGKHRSRKMEEIVEEAKLLFDLGYKEVVLVSQDTTFYGKDLYGDFKLYDLLKEVCKLGFYRVRLLYLYPTEVPRILKAFKEFENLVPYFDIPIQHISDKILKSMRRGYDESFIRKLFERILKEVEGATIRSSLIVGYPSETEGDFKKLLKFMDEKYVRYWGIFKYSREEGTHAYSLKGQIPKKVKEEREAILIEKAQRILEEFNSKEVGKEYEVLIDQVKGDEIYARTPFSAPEIDTLVQVQTKRSLRVGEVVKVKITGVLGGDLIGVC